MKQSSTCVHQFLILLALTFIVGCTSSRTGLSTNDMDDSRQMEMPTITASVTDRAWTPTPATQTTMTVAWSGSTPTGTPALPPKDILQYQCLEVLAEPPKSATLSGNLVLSWQGALTLDLTTGATNSVAGSALDLSVSPNGQWVAYSSGEADQQSIVIQGSTGDQQWQIPGPPGWIWVQGWLDNEQLLISVRAEPLNTTLVLNPFTGERTELRLDYPDFAPPTLSVSNTFFASGNLFPNHTLRYILYPKAVDGQYYVSLWDRKQKQSIVDIEDQYFFGHDPLWSKDGTEFVVAVTSHWRKQSSGKGERMVQELFHGDINGNVSQLTHFGDFFNQAVIGAVSQSPDEQYLAFWLTAEPGPVDGQRLVVYDLVNHTVRNLCIPGSPTDTASPPVWSPNSRQIAIANDYDINVIRVILVDPGAGWAAQVAENTLPRGWIVEDIERTPLDQSPTSALTPQSGSTPTPTLPEKAYVIIEVTPHATLSSDQQENYWNGVIQENRGCALPCVFGITPGHSTWQQVFELYSPFLQATVQYPLSPNMTRFNFGIMFNQDMSINPHMTLLEKNGIVQSVYLQFLSLHSPEAPYLSHQKLDEAVQAYSIDKILDRYGQPSQVLLGLQDGPYEPGAPWPYSIWLLYEKEAFLIVYHFEDIGISRNNEALTVCPVHHALKDLELFAGEPNNQFSLDHFVNEVKGDQWLDQRRDEKAIQFLGEATDLTPESFFETFRSPGNSGCFVSPLDRWTHHSS